MFLPTHKGAEKINLHLDRALHFRGHFNYNRYIGIILDKMLSENKINERDLCRLNLELRKNMRHLTIPWSNK